MTNKWFIAVICAILFLSTLLWVDVGSVAADNAANWRSSDLVNIHADKDGKEIVEITVPGRPPLIKVAPAALPESHIAGVTSSMSNVPAYNWSYGCSATSAAMLFGYYDRTGYSNMYAGPTNGGVAPMDNSIWGPGIGGSDGELPLSATHNGVDGRTSTGHVDDYWIAYGNCNNDPYITNGWGEHIQGNCTGDFMGTNQSKYSNCDASTTFWFYNNGSPLYDYTGQEPSGRDGCHGMRLFAESRGYGVVVDYSQLIQGQGTNPSLGFTFANYMAEIDAGQPVLIQVEGHTMLGFGYDSSGNIVYLHDTWDYSDHQMTWGGTYSGLQHYGVTVIQLAPVAGALDHIVIAPKTASIAAGASQAYTAQAFDQYNNSLGDVTGSASFSITPTAGGSWSGNVYTSQNAGTWTVTAIYSGKNDTATLVVNSPPTVTSVSPNKGYRGQSLKLTISGTKFTGATAVSFGAGVTVNSFNVKSATQISANISISAGAALGSRNVAVTTPNGTGTLIKGFTVVQAPPTVTGVSPNQGSRGQNLSVTITGTNFTDATAVSFGAGITVTPFSVVNSTTISATIAINPTAKPGLRTVSVTTPGGTGSLRNGFTVNK